MVSGPSDAAREGRGPPPPTGRVRRIVLVGFMGSGKTTVGQALARRLGWDFADFDHRIERRAGHPVARIFADQGEAAFRALEAQVGRELLRRNEVVLSTGGGWPARPGRLDRIPPGTLTVWLRVDFATALSRAAREPGTRPLLGLAEADGAQPDLPALFRARETWYRRAHLHLDASHTSPAELADAIADTVADAVADATRDRTPSDTL